MELVTGAKYMHEMLAALGWIALGAVIALVVFLALNWWFWYQAGKNGF